MKPARAELAAEPARSVIGIPTALKALDVLGGLCEPPSGAEQARHNRELARDWMAILRRRGSSQLQLQAEILFGIIHARTAPLMPSAPVIWLRGCPAPAPVEEAAPLALAAPAPVAPKRTRPCGCGLRGIHRKTCKGVPVEASKAGAST